MKWILKTFNYWLSILILHTYYFVDKIKWKRVKKMLVKKDILLQQK